MDSPDRRGTPSASTLEARPNNRVFPSHAQQIRAVENVERSLPKRLTYRFDPKSSRWRHFVGDVALKGGDKLLALIGGIWRLGQYEALYAGALDAKTTDRHIVKALFVVTLEIGRGGSDHTAVLVLFDDTNVALPVAK